MIKFILALALYLLPQQQVNPCMTGHYGESPHMFPYCAGTLDTACAVNCVFNYSSQMRASWEQYCTDIQNAHHDFDVQAGNCQTDYNTCLSDGVFPKWCEHLLNDCLDHATSTLAQKINNALSARRAREGVIQAAFETCFAGCCHE